MSWMGVLHALVVLAWGMLVVLAGGPLVTTVFRHIDRMVAVQAAGENAPGDAGPAGGEPVGVPVTQPLGLMAARHQLRGGTWVGALERIAVYAGVLAHYPEAIGLALAIKGLARYPELRATSTGAAERFIIGTFVSVLIACAGAGLSRFCVHLL